jgi:hypothetical protein
MLVKLLEWKSLHANDFYTRTFSLEIYTEDPMASLVMGSCYHHIIPFARGDHYTHGFYFWTRDPDVELSDCPILMFDGENAFMLVAKNLADFLLASLSNRYIVAQTSSLGDLRKLADKHTPEHLAEFPWAMDSPSNILAGVDLKHGEANRRIVHGGYSLDSDYSSPLREEFESFLRNDLGLELPPAEHMPADYRHQRADTFAKLSYFTTQQVLRPEFDRWQAHFENYHEELQERFSERWNQQRWIHPILVSTLAHIDLEYFACNRAGLEPNHNRMARERFPATIDVNEEDPASGFFKFSVYSLPIPNKKEMARQLLRQPGRAHLVEYDEATSSGTFTFITPGPRPSGRCRLEGSDSMFSLNVFAMNKLTFKRWRFLFTFGFFALIAKWLDFKHKE